MTPVFFYGRKGTEEKVMSDNYLYTELIFDTVTITAGSDSTCDAIDLNRFRPEGYFSLQVTLTGSGTGKIEYLLSNNGRDYLKPSEAEDIVTAHSSASGPGTDGKDIYIFEPEIARFMKIKVTETGGSASIIVTITIAVH